MKSIYVKIVDNRVYDYFSFPRYETIGSAGLDLSVCLDVPVILSPGDTKLFSTGVAIYIADTKIVGVIVPRSGLGHNHGIVLGNLVGIIDSDYQGELFISLWNRSQKDFTVKPGNKIAQLIFFPVIQVKFILVNTFKKQTARGVKGFGRSF